MDYEIGTCIWFGPTYGYLGLGIYTNESYEGQIYIHYKNIARNGLRNAKYREIKPGDIVKFKQGTGFFVNGSQAVDAEVIKYGDGTSQSWQRRRDDKKGERVFPKASSDRKDNCIQGPQ